MRAFFVILFALALASTSATADTTSVRPTDIIAPAGAVDSGVVLAPVAVVRNLSDEVADSVHVTFEVRGLCRVVIYHDETHVLNLGPAESETLSFSNWVPTGRDSLEAVVWTCWAGDSVPEDDTLSGRFMVRTHNIGITQILAPPSVADSGVAYFPRCRVYNYGTQAETFDVSFRIGNYHSVSPVVNLAPNFMRIVTAPDSWLAMPGVWVYRITLVPLNRPPLPSWVDTIVVHGGPRDVAIEQVLAPIGTLDTTTVIRPAARIANYGGRLELLALTMSIHAPGGSLVYSDSAWFALAGGANYVVVLDSTRFRIPGEHSCACSLYTVRDTMLRHNRSWTFLVTTGSGLAEGNAGRVPIAGAATVVRGVLYVGLGTRSDFSEQKSVMSRAVLLDISGRKVADLVPGPNDVSQLSPGVYFVCPKGQRDEGTKGQSRKVIVE